MDNIEAIKYYYTDLYAEFLYKAGRLPFDKAKAMLKILPGGPDYNTLTQLSDQTKQFTVGGRKINISSSTESDQLVIVQLDGDDIAAWPNSDLYDVLYDYELYPTNADMLSDCYVRNWGKHLHDTHIYIEPWCDSLSRTAQHWYLHH